MRISRRSQWPLVAVNMAVLVAACGSSSGISPTASTAIIDSPTPVATAASASPSPRPTPTPKPLAIPRPTDLLLDGTCEAGHVCLGLLDAGTHHTVDFSPGFGFTLAGPGWVNPEDAGGVFLLMSIDRPGDVIAFLRQPWPTNPDGIRVPGVASNVAELRAWLTSNPALHVTEPQPVTVGGLDGVQMDIALAPDASNGMSDCPVQVCVNVFIGRSTTWAWDWGFAGPEKQRLYLLDAADTVVAIFVDSLDGTTFEEMTQAADEIIPTVSFDGT